MKRKLLAAALTVIMILSLLPAAALAAETTVSTAEELTGAITNAQDGDIIKLGADIAISAPIVVSNKTITLDLAEHTISASSALWDDSDGVKHWSLIEAAAGSDLTITGNGKLQTIENDTYAVDLIDGGKCTIENGTIVGNVHAVYVFQGELTVNGGNFSVQQVYSENQPYQFVLNCYDANYKNGTAKITVNGGTFAGFNPRNCEAEGQGTNFCAAGCKVEANTTTTLTTYTVTKVDEGQMIVVPEQSDANEVSASLEGIFTEDTNNVETTSPDGTDPAGNIGSVANNTVTVDMSGEDDGQTTTTASLNVAGETVSSLANNNGSLTIKSDVGKLEVSNDALQTISTKADGSAVTLSIENKATETGTATYELTAKTADGTDVFTESTGTIKVSVPKPDSEATNFYVYYLGPNSAEKIEGAEVVDENVVWEVNHFSTYYITATEQTVSVTVDGQTTTAADLNAAMAAVGADDTATVTLMNDVALSDGVDIAGTVTLDLNGYTITDGEAWSNNDDYLVAVKRGGNLTIEDSSTNKTGAITSDNENIYCAVKMTIKGEAENGEAAILTVNGGTMQGYYYGISGNGTRHGTEITINDGTIQTAYENGTGIYHPQDGSLTVNGGSITGNTGIEIRSGSLTVTGGTITGGNEEPAVVTNGNGTTTSNTGIAIAQHTTKNPITVNITGGTITGSAAVYESNPQNNDGTSTVVVNAQNAELVGDVNATGFGDITMSNVEITGSVNNSVEGSTSTGSIAILGSTITTGEVPTSNITIIDCVDGNGDPIENTTLEEEKTALYNGTPYTLADALSAANSKGGTVYLVADADLSSIIPANTTLEVRKDVKLTVTDLTTVAGSAGKIKINAGGVLNVDNTDMIGGSDANISLTEGSIEISRTGNLGSDLALALDFKGATAEVPAGQRWTTVKNVEITSPSATIQVPMNVTLDEGTTLTVTSTGEEGGEQDGFRVAIGSSLENKGTIVVNGVMTISSSGTVSGGGKIQVSGVLLNVNSSTPDNTITLTSGGKVYSNADISANLSGSKTTLSDKTYNGKDYEYAWQYYVSGGGGTVTPTPTPEPEGLPFTDVAEEQWFYDAVEYVYENGLMNGVTETTFEPDSTTTRGMIVTVLYRMAGSPAVTGENAFTDVEAGSWYEDAIIWAAANGIVEGYGDGTFFPDADVTREQMAAILYRYAEYAGLDVTGRGDLTAFPDGETVSAWAEENVAWAVAEGLLTGRDDQTLDPAGTATRAEIATILMRYCETVAQ